MNNIVVSDNIKIENMIYEIRGKQVTLDSDLAKLYNVETKRINEAVKNNIEKFPERYCFKLNDNQSNNLRSKISTSKTNSHGGRRYNQRVFTEQGVYMLATILKSKVATKITIAIMDAFVVMKSIINTSLIEQKYINSLVLEHDNKIKLLQESFNKLNTKENNNHIFYEDRYKDAYDNKILYHSGASFKDLGKKCFAITKMEDNNILKELLNKLKKYYEED